MATKEDPISVLEAITIAASARQKNLTAQDIARISGQSLRYVLIVLGNQVNKRTLKKLKVLDWDTGKLDTTNFARVYIGEHDWKE